MVGTVVLAAAVAGVLRLLGASQHNLIAAIAGVVFASLIWLPVTRRWIARAHLCLGLDRVPVRRLPGRTRWTGRLDSHLGAASTVGGAAAVGVRGLRRAAVPAPTCGRSATRSGTEHWRQADHPRARRSAVPDSELPMVSLHVPAHNEPPDMVIDTLRSLIRLDYPRYEVILHRRQHRRRVGCGGRSRPGAPRHGVKFAHLEDWPGYKSGALNYALRQLTDADAEIIGVVDSDYQVEPGCLRRCAPAFADPWIGFVQAPQDYRGWQEAPYYRRLYYSYKYFFAVSQPVPQRARRGDLQPSTMGLIRRVALDELGGWDEWCITEDAELSLRLLRAGWHGLHVDQSWGYGIMPLTVRGAQGPAVPVVLRRHPDPAHALAVAAARPRQPGQPPDHRASGGRTWRARIQWYGDLLGLVFFVFLLVGAANLATGGGELFRKLTDLPGRRPCR